MDFILTKRQWLAEELKRTDLEIYQIEIALPVNEMLVKEQEKKLADLRAKYQDALSKGRKQAELNTPISTNSDERTQQVENVARTAAHANFIEMNEAENDYNQISQAITRGQDHARDLKLRKTAQLAQWAKDFPQDEYRTVAGDKINLTDSAPTTGKA